MDTKMYTIEMQSFILLIILWACSYSASESPTILLANGTELFDGSIIYNLYGEPLELFCTGQDYELLMTKNDIKLPTTLINKTTVRLFEKRPNKGLLLYTCKYIKSFITPSDVSYVRVKVDSLPVTEDFLCKSMNLIYLNCSWTSKHFHPKHLLYYVNEGIPTLLCKTEWFDNANYCVWDKRHPLLHYKEDAENLTFIMNTCTGVGCTNQTFDFEHCAIVKFNTPEFDLLSKSSYGVNLGIQLIVNRNIGNTLLERKISYRYSGNHYDAGTSLLSSTIRNFLGYYDEIELKLPCANKFYEVRASVRPQLAVGEEFWSDEAVIHFITDPAPAHEGTDDPTCNQRRAKETLEIMLYLINKFTDNIEEEQHELKIKINALKLKAGLK